MSACIIHMSITGSYFGSSTEGCWRLTKLTVGEPNRGRLLCWFVATSRNRDPHPDVQVMSSEGCDEVVKMSQVEKKNPSNSSAFSNWFYTMSHLQLNGPWRSIPQPIQPAWKHSLPAHLFVGCKLDAGKVCGPCPGFFWVVKSRLGQNMRHEFNLRGTLLKLIMSLLFIFVSSTTTCTTSTVVLGNNWSLRMVKNEKWDGLCQSFTSNF